MTSGDEADRRRIMGADSAASIASGVRELAAVDEAEALRLLASVEYGRIVFTQNALPAIRPVNHLVDNGTIVIRSRLSAAVSTEVDVQRPSVVAYEADVIDPAVRLGWTVVVTGWANPVTDPDDVARLQAALSPWVNMTMDTIIRITPEIITGFRLVAPPD